MPIHRHLAYWQRKARTRGAFSDATKVAVYARDSHTCIYCGAYGNAIDHVFPVKWGGPSIRANAVTSCQRCNGRKSGKLKIDMITRGFYHLMTVGEDMAWTEAAGGKITAFGRRDAP